MTSLIIVTIGFIVTDPTDLIFFILCPHLAAQETVKFARY